MGTPILSLRLFLLESFVEGIMGLPCDIRFVPPGVDLLAKAAK